MTDPHANCNHDWGDCDVENARATSNENMWLALIFGLPLVISALIWLGNQADEGTPSRFGGDGTRVVCNDGWVSDSGGEQGACSWHGGVRQ